MWIRLTESNSNKSILTNMDRVFYIEPFCKGPETRVVFADGSLLVKNTVEEIATKLEE